MQNAKSAKSTNGFRFEVYSFKSEINESRPRADTRVYGRIKYERLIVLLLADKDREMRGWTAGNIKQIKIQ